MARLGGGADSEEPRPESRVRFTGFVPDTDLPALYSGADVFCYPSLYEGFGLPPLEAMACGAPTVTSNTSSLPEVVGDAALTIDPLSVEEMVGALRNLLADSTKRQEYGRRALRQAALFSWDKTARLTRDAYDRITGVVSLETVAQTNKRDNRTLSRMTLSSQSTITMITQDVEVTRRILQEAHTLADAGYSVRIITRSADTHDSQGTVEGLPVEWVAVQGRDPRFGWLYKLAGVSRGTSAAALWSVLTGRHTFTLRATPRAITDARLHLPRSRPEQPAGRLHSRSQNQCEACI